MSNVEDFAALLKKEAPQVVSFTAAELFVKGDNDATLHLNTDPPRDLWPNAIPLAKVLQALRDRVGAPVTLNSVYRSPAYNAHIEGSAAHSQHMEFKAADFTTTRGSPPDWAATLRSMRAAGVFKGGIGTYNAFVHVDVRGSAADWDERTGVHAGVPGAVFGGGVTAEAPKPVPRPVPAPSRPQPTTPPAPPARPLPGNAPTGADIALGTAGGSGGVGLIATGSVLLGLALLAATVIFLIYRRTRK